MNAIGVAAFLLCAGVAAGIIGTAGGITSLVSYPALLVVGIGPFAANVTNAVSLIGSGLTSSLSSRPELREHRATLRSWAGYAAAGGIIGAGLLLVTPPDLFGWIVPILVASASVLLLLQPRITKLRRAGERVGEPAARPMLVNATVVAVSLYSGYFGAGAGMLILAVLMVLVDAHLARANALKNAVLTIADICPGIMFALAGPVSWRAAIPLAAGASIGGLIGPIVTRHAPHTVIRTVAALMGFGLAGWLIAKALQ